MTTTLLRRTPSRAAFATGWYLVGWSRDLAKGGVKPLRHFARDLVLYRGEDGAATLLDAHCPHLGAHLGHGGRVDGNDIVCRFHAWKLGSSGACVAIPYAAKVPPRARVRSYLVREHSGMILAFFGPEGEEPDYDVPVVDELSDPAWTPLETAEIEIATQAREVIENIADRAHFLPVHNTRIDDFEVIIDGPRATQRTVGKGRNLEGEKIDVVTVATYHGPGVQFTRLGWAYPMVLVNAHVPIDENRLLLRFGVSLRAGEGVELPRPVIEAHVAAARNGYFQDVAIWEHKCWRDTPVLVAGDGPIMKVRKWYASFFPGATAPADVAIAEED
jgi:3-ketosteroid 9alpha-monooxygenase subunit A